MKRSFGGSEGLGSRDRDREYDDLDDNGLGLRLCDRDTVIVGRPTLGASIAFGLVDARFPVDAKRVDLALSFGDAPYLDEFVTMPFFAAGDTSRTVSLLGNVEYRLVYDDTAGVSRLMPALRYVPPEYDGRYDAGEEIVPKRGVCSGFTSDVAAFEISSLDEY